MATNSIKLLASDTQRSLAELVAQRYVLILHIKSYLLKYLLIY